MSDSNIQKTVAGTLLIGAGILSANATVLSVAGGIGVNWTSDGLAALWQRSDLAAIPGTPLARAYQRAMERAVKSLRERYASEVGRVTDWRAFDLVADCANGVAQAQYPVTDISVQAAQHELERGLADLLYGHDERQIEFLQRHLLDAVALAFRAELAGDDQAWRRFHGWLIEQLTNNMALLGQSLERSADVLAQLRDAPAALSALTASAGRIEEMLKEVREMLRRRDTVESPVTNGSQTTLNFNNQGANIQGNLNQAQTINIQHSYPRNQEKDQPVTTQGPIEPAAILKALTQRFSTTELRTLCLTLRVDDENIVIEGSKEASALALVKYMQRHDRLTDLVVAMRNVQGTII